MDGQFTDAWCVCRIANVTVAFARIEVGAVTRRWRTKMSSFLTAHTAVAAAGRTLSSLLGVVATNSVTLTPNSLIVQLVNGVLSLDVIFRGSYRRCEPQFDCPRIVFCAGALMCVMSVRFGLFRRQAWAFYVCEADSPKLPLDGWKLAASNLGRLPLPRVRAAPKADEEERAAETAAPHDEEEEE